ncbi:MAG: T9SS type A sorting domain-containing protein [Candidatus Cloacimonetes bacterium]|nr:T9SS type A sorting domain-containing protein [Candidatus Cloacimonadota bacterium]
MKIVLILLFFMFVLILFSDPVIVSGGQQNDYESWLARLDDDRIMLIFCRNPNFSAGELFVTFSEDDGSSWSEPQLIISAPGDQATLSFALMPDQTFQLYYASNETGTYHIMKAISVNGIEWEILGEVELGWQSNIMYYDPTVFLCNDDTLIMTYVVSGQGVFVARTDENGNWDTIQQFIDNSSYRPRIIQASSGNYILTYHKRNGAGQYDYDVFCRYSSDFINWSEPIQLTTNHNSHDPFIQESGSGIYYVYYAKHTGGCYKLHRRTSENLIEWTEEEIITNPISNDTQPHLFFEDNNIYISWAHATNYPNNHDVYFERFTENVLSKEIITEPADFNLSCFPNPFNPVTTISFTTIESNNPTEISIFNIKGQKVKTLLNEKLSSGEHKVTWEGKDSQNNKVSSGVYFYKMKSGDFSKINKMILME